MSDLRPLKFQVQPVLVLDDGEKLTEVTGPVYTVTAADWPTYATEQWPKVLEDLRAEIPTLEEQIKPGRAERRRQSRAKAKP